MKPKPFRWAYSAALGFFLARVTVTLGLIALIYLINWLSA